MIELLFGFLKDYKQLQVEVNLLVKCFEGQGGAIPKDRPGDWQAAVPDLWYKDATYASYKMPPGNSALTSTGTTVQN